MKKDKLKNIIAIVLVLTTFTVCEAQKSVYVSFGSKLTYKLDSQVFELYVQYGDSIVFIPQENQNLFVVPTSIDTLHRNDIFFIIKTSKYSYLISQSENEYNCNTLEIEIYKRKKEYLATTTFCGHGMQATGFIDRKKNIAPKPDKLIY